MSQIIIDETLCKSDCCPLSTLLLRQDILQGEKNPFVHSLFDLVPSFLANRRNHGESFVI